jgi:hypothetical protein
MTHPGVQNHGVYVTGGTVSIGAFATGDHASAVAPHAPDDRDAGEALRRADLMLALIGRHLADVADRRAAEREVLEVRAQLDGSHTPDHDRLTAALGRLTGRVAGVGALTAAAALLQAAVHALIG